MSRESNSSEMLVFPQNKADQTGANPGAKTFLTHFAALFCSLNDRKGTPVSAAQSINSGSADPSSVGADPAAASIETRKVLDALTRMGVPYFLKLLPEGTHSAEEVAVFCDCDVNLIAQSTIYRGKATKKPFLLLHSAATKLNDKSIGAMVGENLQRADSEFALRLTGYPMGTIPPLAHLNRTPVMMDGTLTRFARVWCPAGALNAIVLVPTIVLARAVSARIVNLE